MWRPAYLHSLNGPGQTQRPPLRTPQSPSLRVSRPIGRQASTLGTGPARVGVVSAEMPSAFADGAADEDDVGMYGRDDSMLDLPVSLPAPYSPTPLSLLQPNAAAVAGRSDRVDGDVARIRPPAPWSGSRFVAGRCAQGNVPRCTPAALPRHSRCAPAALPLRSRGTPAALPRHSRCAPAALCLRSSAGRGRRRIC